MFKFIWPILGFLYLVISCPIQAKSLLEAINAAKINNQQLSASLNNCLASKEQAKQGLTSLLPKISIEAKPTMAWTPSHNFSDRLQKNLLSAKIEIQQPIFDIARYSRFKSAHLIANLGKLTFNEAENKLVLDVSNAYLNLITASQKLKTILASQRALEKQFYTVQDEVELGISSPIDADEAQAALDEIYAEALSVKNTLTNYQHEFTKLTGLSAENFNRDFADLKQVFHVENKIEFYLKNSQNNLSVNQKKIEAKLAQAHLIERKGERMPTLSLFAQHEYKENNVIQGENKNTFNSEKESNIGLIMALPLFDGGYIRSKIREANYNALSKHYQYLASQTETTNLIHKNYLALLFGQKRIHAGQQRFLSAQRKLESTHLGKELGIRSNLDIIKAEKEMAEAGKTRAEVFQSYFIAYLQLAYECNLLNEETISKIDNSLKIRNPI